VPVSHASLRPFLSPHSRQSSVSSQLIFQHAADGAETPQAPWEVVRWTKLKKATGQVFSEVGKRNFGRPTCLSVAASLVIGTSKGFILVFDYQQVLKSIIGPGTKGMACSSTLTTGLTLPSRRMRARHFTRHIGGPFHRSRRPCDWAHLHLGAAQAREALSPCSSAGKIKSGRPTLRWSRVRSRRSSSWFPRHAPHRTCLRR
jgi:hypothetical protein